MKPKANNTDRGEIVVYRADDGQIELDVRLENDTIWLSQKQIQDLFGREQSVISRHIRNVFREGELSEASNMQKMYISGTDRPVTFYDLDVIISVGYRVKSSRGTRFRIWATDVLRQHWVNGYSANEKRLTELKKTLSWHPTFPVAKN